MTTLQDEFYLEASISPWCGCRGNHLVPLERTDPSYLHVKKLFHDGWKHNKKTKPYLRAVFKILSTSDNLGPYLAYRQEVQSLSSLQYSPKPGNECLLFHGTARNCLLGEQLDNVIPCALYDCCLCSIIRHSFDIEKCGTKHKFTRFGTGIYTTTCSSKADDYVVNGVTDAPHRALLLNRVIVGRPLRRRKNAIDLVEPPCGYHSIMGEPGEDLNYEETVVYRNDAIRPAYLLVYGDAFEYEPDEKAKFKAFIRTLFKTPLAS